MEPATIVGIIVAAVIVWVFVVKFLPKRQPQPEFFTCPGCNSQSRHNERTLEASRNNEAKLLCPACEAKAS